MRKWLRYLVLLITMIGLQSQTEPVTPEEQVVYRFEIRDQIGPPTWRITKEAIAEAEKMGADVILLVLNTYGGLVSSADSIRTKLLDCPIPIIVYIENNAASAGALISIACDSIYMKPGSTIGAATVVNQSGEQVPDKYQSYMRKKMRATAEETGRDPDIAEAMVDPDKVVDSISEKGKVVTFSTQEAVKYGFCDGIVSSPSEALAKAGYGEAKVVQYTPSTIDKFINWLIDPIISGILIMMIVGGIYFELQSPGLGLPIGIAILGGILYFAPLYLEGLADNWEIIVFFLGLVLLAVEVFVVPGFGIFGISGIIMMVFGLALSMVGNVGFDFTGIDLSTLVKSVFVVIISSSVAVGASIALGARLLTSHAFSKLILNSSQERDKGFVSSGTKGERNHLGKTAVTATVLRPSGKIELEGDLFDATASAGFIDAGKEVIIESFQSAQFFVRAKNE